MHYKEAMELVSTKAASKYHGSALVLLQKLTKGLYEKFPKSEEIEDRRPRTKAVTMRGWIGVTSDRQLRRLLNSLEEIEVVDRSGGKITYKVNLEPLKIIQKPAAILKEREEEQRAIRAQKARSAYAANREEQRVQDSCAVMRELRPKFFAAILHPQRYQQNATA